MIKTFNFCEGGWVFFHLKSTFLHQTLVESNTVFSIKQGTFFLETQWRCNGGSLFYTEKKKKQQRVLWVLAGMEKCMA